MLQFKRLGQIAIDFLPVNQLRRTTLVLILVFTAAIAFFLSQDIHPVTATSIRSITEFSVAAPYMPDEDTYIASGHPNEAPSAPNLGIFWVGHNESAGFLQEQSLLKFKISSDQIPVGSTINSAHLYLTLSGFEDRNANMNVTVRRLLSDSWGEDATWNQINSLPVTDGVTLGVGRELNKEYEWNLLMLVQEWANDSTRIALSLRLEGDSTSGNHERNFWSKDCPENECTSLQRPQLVIEFSPPSTATPTPTRTTIPTVPPTFTPTPTPTPTPAPGVAVLTLENDPNDTVNEDEEVVYTISFMGNHLKAGAKLSNLVITDTVPVNTQLIVDSLEGQDQYIITHTGLQAGSTINWTRKEPFPIDESDTVSYSVVYSPSLQVDTPQIDDAHVDGSQIYNDGVVISWDFSGITYAKQSNPVCNPGPCPTLYLPIIRRIP
ncbi:MAG: DNRLRE domain-containing protein [Caldilineaceae bacterium]